MRRVSSFPIPVLVTRPFCVLALAWGGLVGTARLALIGVALMTGALASGLSAQIVLHVDPVLGQDLPGRGSQSMPLRSLTFATSQVAPGVVLHEYRLAPGEYGAANGEVFPIRPPSLAAFLAWPRREGGRDVVLDTGGVATAIEFAPAGVGLLFLRGLDVRGADRSLVAQAPGSSPINVVVEESRFRGGVEISAGGSSIAQCSMRSVDVDGGIVGFQSESSVLQLDLDRCGLRADGRSSALDVLAVDGSASWTLMTLRSCAIVGGPRSGVRLTEGAPATWNLRFEHCSFVGNGLQPGAFRGAALSADLGPSPAGLGFLVENSLFVDNAHDAPVAGAFCTFGSNLVEQLDLANLGANQVGRAQLVDVGRGDLHLVPGSPGKDLANLSETTLFADRDGDLRWTGIDPLGDLGCDEYVPDSVHSSGETASGTTWHLVIETDPMLATALVAGTELSGIGPEIDGLRLAGAIVIVPTSEMSDADGIADHAITVPSDPALIGLRLYWQAGVARAPYYGRNVWRTFVER